MDSPFDLPILNNGGIPQTHNDIGSLLLPPQGINIDPQASDVSSSVCTISAPAKVQTHAPDIPTISNPIFEEPQLIETTPSDCGCLTQSIDLLRTLSAQADLRPYLSTSSSEPQEAAVTLTDGFCESVLTENRLYLETVNERLTCRRCSGDSFLLAVLSMTVMKILERYAAAARGQSNDRGRNAAQLVLSELHRVQRLVNHLSPKLRKSHGGTQEAPIDPELWGYQGMTQCWDRGSSAPFSVTTLGQMDSDVRKGLGALSSEIINGLREN
ncbi:hypothetical protein KVR01_011669 [Diaporthe batatas]|uniref:uncharacterized protein n=1 Tax=Diaporthe batatas TaxID=748121 RepID=UPI001D051FB0|nr:uncharacterized protein KVR01_011669 [Diaporthe batatas]KAG8158547.1 hypothetical protein KVR01_011669 [Diaporthe batatas]